MTLYNLTLDPESPTSYLVDGVSTALTSSQASVEILRADGSVDTETRTLWRSEYGPIIDFPGVGWTDSNVLTYRDANIDNDEFIEQYARLAEVRSIADLEALNAEYQGQPLFNTVAADADGNVWYADASATPNLSDEAQLAFLNQLFTEPIIQFVYNQGAVLLDGSDSRFRWVDDPGARDPGLVAYADMPRVERTDYVFNANDSYWIPNVEAPLTGAYSFLHGTQNTPLSMRTRQNASVLGAANEAGLAGPDGLFDADEVRAAAFENSGHTAGLLLRSTVAACTAAPIVEVDDAPVDLTEACRVLAGWDGIYDLDRSGPIIWRETMTQFDDTLSRSGAALRRFVRSGRPDSYAPCAGAGHGTAPGGDGSSRPDDRRRRVPPRLDPRRRAVQRTVRDAGADPRWCRGRRRDQRRAVERRVQLR